MLYDKLDIFELGETRNVLSKWLIKDNRRQT